MSGAKKYGVLIRDLAVQQLLTDAHFAKNRGSGRGVVSQSARMIVGVRLLP